MTLLAPPYSTVAPAFYDPLHPAINWHDSRYQDSSTRNQYFLQHNLHHQHPHDIMHALPEESYSSRNFYQLPRQTAFDFGASQPLYYHLSTAPSNGYTQQPQHNRRMSGDAIQQNNLTVQAPVSSHQFQR